ncbi:MAG: signal peptidase [Actinomycetota bacterium]|nr:signal peptidase [Actinomycetota bacterium]
MLVLWLLALGTVLLDQVTKAWAVAELTGRRPVEAIDGILQLHLVRNSGAAFSFASGTTWIFTVIASVVAVVIVRVSRRLGSLWWAVSLGLLLGGALGNLLDRLFRAPGFGTGHVVDFLELPHWPVFNVADSCIVAAACVLSLTTLRGIEVDGTRYTPSKNGAEALTPSCEQQPCEQEQGTPGQQAPGQHTSGQQAPGRRPEGQGSDV